MTQSETSRSVVVEREFPHAPEKVWRALTEQALLEDWLMAGDFVLEVGRKFTFRATPIAHWNGVTDCEVLEIVPQHRLSYTWNASGSEAVDGLKTIVTWTLAPTSGGGTHLRMEQSGFRAKDEQNQRGAVYGWQRFIASLEGVVASLE